MPTITPKLRLLAIAISLFASLAPASALASAPAFQSARPIWPEGREREKNVTVAFRAVISAPANEPVTLRLAGQALCRVLVNGRFAGHGPARAAHGFYRVDEWNLTPHLHPGDNVVAVEVAGYNVNSYYLLDQPSFLQAEVVAGGKVLASTAGEGVPFEAAIVTERVQRVARYSFQRPFSEIWRLTPGWDAWRTVPGAAFARVPCEVLEPKALLARGVPYPHFDLKTPVTQIASGTLTKGAMPEKPWRDSSLTSIGPKLGGFRVTELESVPGLELQAIRTTPAPAAPATAYAGKAVKLSAHTSATFDYGVNRTGFIGARVEVRQPTRLFFTFDEVLTEGDVSFTRADCVNIVAYELAPGSYEVESFEPYTLRYLKLMVLEGDCDVAGLTLREYVNPEAVRADFSTSDPRLNRIFAAARETFAQNAVDIFMDCPSRERAGWLCDSFFTARTAASLCGTSSVEKNFLENFLLPEKFDHLPAGMLPMCYPADHYNGIFITNWALWFVLELEEYSHRTGDRRLVEAFRPRLHALLDYFKPFENESGLLEKLPSWVFVEWSKANSFTQDVNYPSNMVYAGALAAMARMYDEPALAAKAEHVRAEIRRQSFDGEFFVDNAVRKDGQLQVTRNRTEVCQYYAFYFDIATPATHGRLWQVLTTDFGPQRKETKAHPEIWPANAFIGNQLRFELLSRHGRRQQIIDESAGYWLYMVDRTGTLWENDRATASCNHGFASHAAHLLIRDVLGFRSVDPVGKVLHLGFSDLKLDWCQGLVPTPDGFLEMSWRKDGEKIVYRLSTPPGWKVEVQNDSGREVGRQ